MRRLRKLFLESLERREVLAAALYAVPIGQGNFIVELNPTTGAEIRRFASPAPVLNGPEGLAFNGESLFFLSGPSQLYELNPATGAVIDSDSLAGIGSGNFDGIGALAGKLYLQDHNAGRIHVYDPTSDVLLNSLTIAGGVTGGLTGASSPDELIATVSATSAVRINPATGAVTGTINLGGAIYLGVAAVGNQLYFSGPNSNQIRVTDRAGTFVSNVTAPYSVSALASDDTRIERISNGSFELGSAGWTTLNFGAGSYQTYTGANPFGSALPAPPVGAFAMANNHSGPGTYILQRDLVLPAGQSHTLSLTAYYENRHTAFITPASLDFQAGQNQQFRIDIVTTAAAPFSVSPTDVLQNVFKTNVGDPLIRAPFTLAADLSSFAGQTVRLRIAVANSMNFLWGAVDGISLLSNSTPTPPSTQTRVYVAEAPLAGGPGGRVEVFDENLVFLSTIDDPVFDTGIINDVEIGPTGDVFVAIDISPTIPGKIARFTTTGSLVNVITLPVDGVGQPFSVLGFDVADDGTFWVAHPSKANRVFHVSAAGAFLGETPVGSPQPYDVSVSSTGQLFASNGSLGEGLNSLRSDGNRWQARFGAGDAQLLSPGGALLATRTVGGQIIDAQESNAGNLYLTQFGTTNSVRRFDAAGTASGTVNTLERAVGIAVTTTTTTPPPATTRIYVAESDPLDGVGGRVEVYDESLALQSTIDDPVFDTGSINDVELGPTGDVFVSMDNVPGGQGRIVRFTSTGTFVSSITLPSEAAGPPIRVVGFDVADDGTFWVVHPNRPSRAFHISAAGALLGDSGITQTQPIDVAVSTSGQLFVATLANGEALNSLRADGNRWQARSGPGDAVLLSPTNTVLATRTPGGPILDAQEADSGNLFLTRNGTTNSVLKYTSAGVAAGTISTPERAVGIAISTAVVVPPPTPNVTRIYVSEREPDGIGGRIEVFNDSLALVSTIDHPVLDTGTLSDVEVGPNGNIFVALDTTTGGNPSGAGGQLVEFTPAGTFVGIINLPVDANGSSFFPLGFDVASDGSFRVAATNTPNTVFNVSPSGTNLGNLFTSASSPVDVAIGSGTNLYVSSASASEASINLRADGNLWVTRLVAGVAELRSPGGTTLASRSFGPQPVDTEESSSGDLYMVRLGTTGSLRKFDAAGNTINTANLTDFGVGVAVASVPTTFQVTSFTATKTGAMLDFSAALDPSPLNLYDALATYGTTDVTLQGATVGNVRGSLVVDPGLRRVTFVATTGRLPPDTYTLTLRSAADGFVNASQQLLDGDANGTAGGNYVRTFTVDPPPANAVAISIANFSRGPQQQVNIPASSTMGLPIAFSDGGGITSANFEIRYNPALLNIQAAAVSPGLPPNAGVTLTLTGPGVALIQFTSGIPLPAGTTNFVQLQATVPDTAAYRTKHVLDIANISLNSGAISGLDDDAVHVVAYFGDVTANGAYSAQDASRVSRLAVGLDTGFAPFKLLDPIIIADLTGNGAISAQDTSRALQVGVGITVADVPPLPNPPLSLTQGGPDPKLSLPANLVARPGEELTIPVHIDSIVDLTGNGLESGDLVLFYDPAVLDVQSVGLGSLLQSAAGNWVVGANIDPLAGRIIVSFAGSIPLEGLFVGELVQLQATVKESATAGASAINLAASSRSPGKFTQLNEGWLTLIPAPTDAANDAGVDGVVTVIDSRANAPTAVRLLDDQLLISGTSGDDRIFVAPMWDDRIRVRIGNRIVGDYPAVSGIAIDSLGGQDYVVISHGMPLSLIVTPADDDPSSDIVFGSGRVAVVSSQPTHVSSAATVDLPEITVAHQAARDEALLQLLAAWTDDSSAPESSASRPTRVRRL